MPDVYLTVVPTELVLTLANGQGPSGPPGGAGVVGGVIAAYPFVVTGSNYVVTVSNINILSTSIISVTLESLNQIILSISPPRTGEVDIFLGSGTLAEDRIHYLIMNP